MKDECGVVSKSSKILPIVNKCGKIRVKIKSLEKAMKIVEKKSLSNIAWRGLLNSAVSGMNDALCDLEKRLKHIESELKEFMVFAFIFLLSGMFFVSGCASLKEAGKKVWGSSIEHLEKERADGKTQNFTLSFEECFSKVTVILASAGAEVYLQDKDSGYMAAMNFKGSVDTTQAGIFFTKLDDAKTKIEVASMSPRLVDDVSELVFGGLKDFRTE